MSPPRPFGHILLFQHSPECLFITRRNRGNRGGVGWSGKGAGITLCHTPDCLETNRLLPSPNPALLCAWPEAPALSVHRGEAAGARLCVSLAWERSSGLAKQSRELGMGKHGPATCRGITGSEESKVQVCLDPDLDVSLLQLCFTGVADGICAL